MTINCSSRLLEYLQNEINKIPIPNNAIQLTHQKFKVDNGNILFVAQKQAQDHNQLVITAAITFHEYPSSRCLFIQYVDSTGAFSPREYQGYFLKHLIGSLIAFYAKVLGYDQNVHLLASPKPSFLFRGSELNSSKHPINSSIKLMRWWIECFQKSCSVQSVDYYIPGCDRQRDLFKKDAFSIPVNYGLGPYSEKDDVEKVLLEFPTDSKTHHLKALKRYGKTLPKMREFMESLAATSEFRENSSAFLFAKYFSNENNSPNQTATALMSSDDGCLNDYLNKCLYLKKFSTIELIQEASKEILENMEKYSILIPVNNLKVPVINRIEKNEETTVKNIQNLVKRRKE